MAILEKFLREKNVFEQFKHNLETQEIPERFEDFNRDMGEYQEAIDCAFTWSETQEGHKFWLDLRTEYLSKFDTYQSR